jgi:ferritin-like metal-binding protein YciE
VEHCEIARYGCVRTYAKLLGNNSAMKLLQQTLDEEGNTDKTLTKLAEAINVEAEEPDDEEEPPTKATKKKAAKKAKGRVARV